RGQVIFMEEDGWMLLRTCGRQPGVAGPCKLFRVLGAPCQAAAEQRVTRELRHRWQCGDRRWNLHRVGRTGGPALRGEFGGQLAAHSEAHTVEDNHQYGFLLQGKRHDATL